MNKLLAIFGRTDAKDFVDLHFLIKENKFDISDLYSKAEKKGVGLSEFYLANMLAEVENLSVFPKIFRPLDHKQLKKFFLSLSHEFYNKIKPKK